ncbi:MAG: hypothetical protein Q9183_003995, partial [Haloplaca sp. 2 TL-2023]
MTSFFNIWGASEKPKSLKRPPSEDNWQSESEDESKAKKVKPNHPPAQKIEVIVSHRNERNIRNTGRSRLDRSRIGLVKDSSLRSRPENKLSRMSGSSGPVTPQNHLRFKQIIQGHNRAGQCNCGCQCRCQRQNVCQCGCQSQCQGQNVFQCGCNTAKSCCGSKSPPAENNGVPQDESPVKPADGAAQIPTKDVMQQITTAKDQTIAVLKEQSEYLKDKLQNTENQRDKAGKDLQDVHARASACHRKMLPCQKPEPADGCGKQPAGKLDLKQYEESLVRTLRELGVCTNVSGNKQSSATKDHLEEKVDEVQVSVQSIGTRQEDFEARMEARLTAVEQTASDNLLGVQSNLGEQIESTAAEVRSDIHSQLKDMGIILSQQMGRQLEAFAQNLVPRPTVDETVILRMFVPFAKQMEEKMNAFMRELSSRPITTAAPDAVLQTQIAELQAKNTTQEQQILTLTGKVTESEANMQSLDETCQGVLSERDQEIKDLQGTIDENVKQQAENSSDKSAETKALFNENEELKAEIAELKRAGASRESEIKSKEKALQTCEEGRSADRKTFQSQDTEAERREQQQAELQKGLDGTIKAQEDTINDLNDKAKKSADKFAKLEKDVETLKKDSAKKDKTIQDLTSKNGDLRGEASAAIKTRDEVKNAGSNLLEQLAGLNKEVEELKANEKKTTQANIDLIAENKKLQGEQDQASTEQIVAIAERENIGQPTPATNAPLLIEGPPAAPQPAPAIIVNQPAPHSSPRPHTEEEPQVMPQPVPEIPVEAPAPNTDLVLHTEQAAATTQPDPSTAMTTANAEGIFRSPPAKGEPRKIALPHSRIAIVSKIEGESSGPSKVNFGKKILDPNFDISKVPGPDVSGVKDEAPVDTAPPETPVPAPQPPTQPVLNHSSIFSTSSREIFGAGNDVRPRPTHLPLQPP